MKVLVFAKHLKGMGIPELVAQAKRQGVDGYDFPVRAGYAANPENVATALPELAKAMAAEGLSIPMVTGEGALLDPAAPEAERIMAAMAEAKATFLKLGYWRYEAGQTDYYALVKDIRVKLDGWQKLAEKHGVTVCYHTHSGTFMGCTAGAAYELLRDFDPRYVAAYIDAGHICVQAEPFPMACDILREHLKVVALKDLRQIWVENDGRRYLWREAVRWGQGSTDLPLVMQTLKRIGFDGPLSVHIEYEGEQDALIEGARADVQRVRAAMRDAELA